MLSACVTDMGVQAWLLLRHTVWCAAGSVWRPDPWIGFWTNNGAAGCWPAVCRAVGYSLYVGLAGTIGLSLIETTQVRTANLLEQAASLLVYLESTQVFCCAGDRRKGCAWAGWAPHSPSGSVIARRATAIMVELAPRMTSHSFFFLPPSLHVLVTCQKAATPSKQ